MATVPANGIAIEVTESRLADGRFCLHSVCSCGWQYHVAYTLAPELAEDIILTLSKRHALRKHGTGG